MDREGKVIHVRQLTMSLSVGMNSRIEVQEGPQKSAIKIAATIHHLLHR